MFKVGDPDARWGGSLDGAFEGLDVIFVRGLKSGGKGEVVVEVTTREGQVFWTSSSARLRGLSPALPDTLSPARATKGGSKIRWESASADLKQTNVVLSSLRYDPSGSAACGEGDTVKVAVWMQGGKVEKAVEVRCE